MKTETLTFTSIQRTPAYTMPLFGLATVEVPAHVTTEEYMEALQILGCIVTRRNGVLLDEQ